MNTDCDRNMDGFGRNQAAKGQIAGYSFINRYRIVDVDIRVQFFRANLHA